MTQAFSINRRSFIGATAGGFTFGFVLGGITPTRDVHAATNPQVNSWLNVGSDNSITLTIGSTDMGQGSFAGLGQILAEDLMVDFNRVTLIQGGPVYKVSPAPIGSAIVTAGSGVTRNNYWKLRDAAAITRETLVQAAMNRLHDGSRANFTVNDGVIRHASGKLLTYGDVAADAALLTPPASAPLVPDAQFKSIGQSLDRPDIPLKVDGSAKYGIDIRLPGMVFAVIKHCPTFGGTLAATPSAPRGSLGLVAVRVAPGTGRGADLDGNINALAVVAGTTWDAIKAANSLRVQWKLPAQASNWSTDQFFAQAQSLADSPVPYAAGSPVAGMLYTVESEGDVQAALTWPNTKVVDATYKLPYVAHACMEVLTCTVDYVAGQHCSIHAPTQVAGSALALAVALTGLAANQITFHTTLLGGGLGRKAEIDFIGQAIQVGMALGRPVQLVWPREEDFTHDQYRPMALVRTRAGVNASGNITAWNYRNVSPSISAQRGRTLGPTGDSQATEASQELPYRFASRRVDWVNHPAPIPVGYWRSVGASINTFAVESLIDELAAAAGQDPLQFRRNNLTDPRWLAVLDTAAGLGNWSTAPRKGTARGIAIGTAFNSIVATVVEISGTSASAFSVNRVSIALDCYLTVNPKNVEAQLVGGAVHGLNAALYGQQTFVSGVAQRRNFNTSRMMKINEMPAVSVSIVENPGVSDRNVRIGGVGELGVPTLAPALANAIFRLSGQRVRELPIFPSATMRG
jgi:isoquinoline 1-oxidoreductase subunit beta